MTPCLWSTTHNGRFKIISLTADTLKPALSLMKSSFFKYETTSKIFDVPNNIKSIDELTNLALEAAKDGISLVAQDTQNNQIVSAQFNKILLRNEKSVYQKHFDQCKEVSSKEFLRFIIDTEIKYDIFDHYNHDCGIEFMFSVTDPKYCRKNLASDLFISSLKMAKMLAKKQNVKTSISGEDIPLRDTPKSVIACATMNSNRIFAESLGFQVFHEMNLNDYYHEGQTFASKIGNICERFTKTSIEL